MIYHCGCLDMNDANNIFIIVILSHNYFNISITGCFIKPALKYVSGKYEKVTLYNS